MQKTKVIGIGISGARILDCFIKKYRLEAEKLSISINSKSLADRTLFLPEEKGPHYTIVDKTEIFELAKNDYFQEIIPFIGEANTLFLFSGLAGKISAGILTHIAKMSPKDVKIISVINTPFFFEGAERKKTAEDMLQILKSYSDMVIAFDLNDYSKVLEVTKELQMPEVLDFINTEMGKTVQVIYDNITLEKPKNIKESLIKKINYPIKIYDNVKK